jgi:hypothetical protein
MFLDTEDMQENVTTALKAISQQKFQTFFQQRQHSWPKCKAAQGGYFEGDPPRYTSN